MLELAAQLNSADLGEVKPMAHPLDAVQRVRVDTVTEDNLREKFQTIAQATENGYFLVPKVIE